jgi:photosystem II stability/assembly factor-like uncharacterized protein
VVRDETQPTSHAYRGLFRFEAGRWERKVPCTGTTDTFDQVAFDPSENAYVFMNENQQCPGPPEAQSFLSSTDGGTSWQLIGSVCGGQMLAYVPYRSFLSIFPSSPAVMYASRWGGSSSRTHTCNTTDGGLTWNDVTNGSTSFIDVQVAASDALDVVKAGNEGGGGAPILERTSDGGRTWETRFVAPAGLTCCMRRASTNPSLVLVGTGQGLYKSTDRGTTFSPVPIRGQDRPITALAIDPSDADIFYVGTGEGIFRSADSGTTWEARSTGLVRRVLGGVAVSRSEPGTVVVSAGEGPYVSRSGGDSWTLSASGIANLAPSPVAVSPVDPALMYAGSADGVYRSENRGVTWSPWTDPSPAGADRVVVLDADPFDAGVVLAGLDGSKGLFRSTNRGQTWAGASAGLPFTEPTDLAFARDVAGRVYVSFLSSGIYRSTNGGTAWSAFGLNGQTVDAVAPAPSNSAYVYAASGPTLFFMDPGVGSWTAATTGPSSPIVALAVEASNPLVAYAAADHPGTGGATGGVYKTTDGGRNWSRLAGVLDAFDLVDLATHPTTGGTVYAATLNGGVYRSTDGGLTWTELADYGTVADLINVTVKHPSDALLYAATEGYGVQVSSDGGRSFVPRVLGLASLDVNAIAFEPASATVMYAGTGAGVFKSVDAGNTWAATAQAAGEITDLVTDNDGAARRIWASVRGLGVAYSADGGATFAVRASGLATLELTSLALENLGSARRIWASTRGRDGVYYSDDLGQTWRPAAGTGLLDRDVNDLTLQTGAARRIWASTDDGVFFSDDGGSSWASLSLGLPAGAPATSVSIDPGSGEAFVSLDSASQGGVYRGGNLGEPWSAFNAGLDALTVRRLTNDGGRSQGPGATATTFYASTAGEGNFAAEVRTAARPVPTITTTGLARGIVGTAYSQTLAATGGTPPYSWSVLEGALPAGLRLHPATGVVSGTPAEQGFFSFAVQVRDAASRTDREDLSIAVESPNGPAILGFAPAAGPVGTQVTIGGVRFTGATTLAFGGTGAAFTVDSDARITATVPPAAQSGPIRVTTPLGSATSAGSFTVTVPPQKLYTLPPCRMIDTRGPAGPLGDPPLQGGGQRTFGAANVCGVPPTAKAISVNLTVTAPDAAGDLRIFPAGLNPPLVSSINYGPGQTRANNAIVPLSAGGAFRVQCDQATGTVHFIVDVNGYFE